MYRSCDGTCQLYRLPSKRTRHVPPPVPCAYLPNCMTWHDITSHPTILHNFILLAVKLMSDRQQRALIATRKDKQVKRENVFLLRPKQIQEQASDCRIPADGTIVLEMEWKTSSKLGKRGEKCWVQTLITRGRSATGYPTSSNTACLGLIQGVS